MTHAKNKNTDQCVVPNCNRPTLHKGTKAGLCALHWNQLDNDVRLDILMARTEQIADRKLRESDPGREWFAFD